MDTYKIVVSPEAGQHIDEIIDYVRSESEQGAEFLAGKLEEAIDSLNVFPHRHPVRDRRRDPTKNTFGMVVNSYLVYYRIDEARKVVRITCVRHGARRQPRRFP